MASSTAAYAIAHRAQFQYPTWPKPTKSTKNRKNLLFLSDPSTQFLSSSPALCSSSSFPVSPKSLSYTLEFRPLKDAVQDNIIENLENSMNFQIPIDQESETGAIINHESRRSIFILDPPWISSLLLKGLYKKTKRDLNRECKEIEKRKYNLLRRRQIKEETEAWERMVEEYRELEREMCERKLAPNLPHVKGLFLGWLEPLRDAIDREQKLQRSKKQKAAFAPHIDLLPADKMALIVMHKMMGLVMVGHDNGCVQVVQAAVQIGMAIEQEVRIEDC